MSKPHHREVGSCLGETVYLLVHLCLGSLTSHFFLFFLWEYAKYPSRASYRSIGPTVQPSVCQAFPSHPASYSATIFCLPQLEHCLDLRTLFQRAPSPSCPEQWQRCTAPSFILFPGCTEKRWSCESILDTGFLGRRCQPLQDRTSFLGLPPTTSVDIWPCLETFLMLATEGALLAFRG